MNAIIFIAVPGLSSDSPRHKEYWGGGGVETTEKISQIKVTENSLIYCSRNT
jgi:hypothetical protein